MNKVKLDQLAHLVAGFATLVEVFNWFEMKNFTFTAYYLAGGCFFLLLAGAHKYVQRHFTNGEIAFFLLEASFFLFSGWQSRERGNFAMTFVFGSMALAYVALALVTTIQIISTERRHSGRRRGRRSRRSALVKHSRSL